MTILPSERAPSLGGLREDFLVVKIGRRPLLAVPVVVGTARAAFVQCYPGHTWKKRVLRHLIRAAFWTGLAPAIWARCSSPVAEIPAVELEAWIEKIRQGLGGPQLQPVFVWPANAARGRIYVHWQDAQGNVAAFTKLALDAKSSGLLENERNTLEQLGGMQLQKSRVPRVLFSGRLREFFYLVVEVAPRDARITNWQTDLAIEENVREFAGVTRKRSRSEVEILPWWRPLMEYLDGDFSLERSVRNATKEGLDVCRVHGDLNQTNILRTAGEVWLLDWETSSDAGPCLTDTVCMEVDQLWPLTKKDAAKGLEAFLHKMWHVRGASQRQQTMLALAFLSMCAFPPALVLFEEWKRNFGGDADCI